MPLKSVGTLASRPSPPNLGDEYTSSDTTQRFTCYVAGTWTLNSDVPLTNLSPLGIDVGDAAAVGTGTAAAREDHQHALPAPVAPPDITDATAAAGTSTKVAREDHTHGHGNRGGGTLHAVATASVAGFESAADKTKLDGIATGATNTPLASVAPVNVTKAAAAVGVGTTAARDDHKHDVSTAVPGSALIGDAATEGVATTLARSDHKHAIAAPAAPANVSKSAAVAGAATGPARADHKHDIDTASPTAAVDIGDAAAEGTATTLARSDHQHSVPAPAAPVNVTKAAAAAGTATTPARADHKHDITTAAAIDLTDATNAEGVATSLARSDHTHSHGARGGGTLHAVATQSVAGFQSAADKAKLDNSVLARYLFIADQFINPLNADWAVNALGPLSIDTVNAAIRVRRFDDTVDEGAGGDIYVPAGAGSIRITIQHRAQAAPGGSVNADWRMYFRLMPDNAALAAWILAEHTSVVLPAGGVLWQRDVATITLATEGIVADSAYQFEFVRYATSGADTLVGDWVVQAVMIEFIP